MGRAHEVRKQSMAKTSLEKSILNARASKEIYMAAKQGGTDPNANLALRSMIDKAKAKKVSSETIARAIKKAEGGSEENYLPGKFEGFFSSGIMIIVDTLTNNVNRAAANVKMVFKKNDAKIGIPGSVSHFFSNISLFRFKYHNYNELWEKLINCNVEFNDLKSHEEGIITLIGKFEQFNNIQKFLQSEGITNFIESETTVIPNDYLEIQNEEILEAFKKFLSDLENDEDVQSVYHNVKYLD
ncbi:YebC/PmpR family DNA-binding transcriptional regulator [Spiroplasma endosymbiont of Amphibalanus improvisus]|uniref:YebC/PmpR family DNA-binding transcriptional regulator n=1 Tax=Spiroplasma endosymbiont of Amphibalanus improvisus TaxID=3066327 RepID=UPI00313B86F2